MSAFPEHNSPTKPKYLHEILLVGTEHKNYNYHNHLFLNNEFDLPTSIINSNKVCTIR